MPLLTKIDIIDDLHKSNLPIDVTNYLIDYIDDLSFNTKNYIKYFNNYDGYLNEIFDIRDWYNINIGGWNYSDQAENRLNNKFGNIITIDVKYNKHIQKFVLKCHKYYNTI